MPSLKRAPPCLPLAIKDSLKEVRRPFAFVLFVFDREGFWLLVKGGFLMWEALEGKGISEGKRIAQG
jgi:hypothetical protein